MDRGPIVGFAVLAALAAVGVAVGLQVAEPLPASFTPFALIPPILGGIYLLVSATWIRDQGLYGAVFGRLPGFAHVGLCAVGFALVGGSIVAFGKLPSAAVLEAERLGVGLDGFCLGERPVRVDRELLPALERLHALRGDLRGSPRDAVDVRLRAVGVRCVPWIREAFADPDGAHVTWRRLRDTLGSVPEVRPAPSEDPVWAAVWRERDPSVDAPRSVGRPVVVEIGGDE